MVFYMRWIRSARPSALLAASACAALGTTIRYESWIFVFVFLLLLVIRFGIAKNDFHAMVARSACLLLTCAFPVYWIIDSYRDYHVFLVFVSSHSQRYSHVAPKTFLKLIWRNPATQFIVQNGVSLNLIGMLPVIGFFKKDKQLRRFILLPAIAMIVFAARRTGRREIYNAQSMENCGFMELPFASVYRVPAYRTAGTVSKKQPKGGRRSHHHFYVLVSACMDDT